MPSSKASYEEKVQRNLVAMSVSQVYVTAVMEWDLARVFTTAHRCELCGHVIRHNFEMHNRQNQNVLRIGCCCVVNIYHMGGASVAVISAVEAQQAQAEGQHLTLLATSEQYRASFEVEEDQVRGQAPYSVGDMAEAISKARSQAELEALQTIRQSYISQGFVMPQDWALVRKLNRRNRVRNLQDQAALSLS